MAKQGVTLVELLIVIMIIGILMGVIIPQLSHNHEDCGAKGYCKNNMRSLYQSLHVYAKAHGTNAVSFPPMVGKKFWMKLCEKGSNVLGITDDDYAASIFQCPVRGTSGNAVKYRGPGSTLQQSDPIGCDDASHPGDTSGGSVLHRDGSVEVLQGAEWDTAFGKCVE